MHINENLMHIYEVYQACHNNDCVDLYIYSHLFLIFTFLLDQTAEHFLMFLVSVKYN